MKTARSEHCRARPALRCSFRLLLGLGACYSGCQPVLAWNGEGHMIVAQIAYNHLDPNVKARCDALIAVPLQYAGSSSSNFVTAACWADDYKSQLGSGIWHYIDLPFSLDGTSTNGAGPAASNVVWAINQGIYTLGSGTSAQTNLATWLRYLLHFVGDIEQPLHCSTAVTASHPGGDYGGNDFYINGAWDNLHSLWDAGGGFLTDSLYRPLNSASQATLSNKVASIEADYPYTPNPGRIPNPMDWALEGYALAQTNAYAGITQNTSPSADYLSKAQATTEQRMAAGGHRLADLLNTLFQTNGVVLTCLASNGTCGFAWDAIPGRVYQVQWKEQLTDSAWNALTNIPASSNWVSFSEAPLQAQRFYRVTQ
ncbi:MAG TPA: S1/P1 nuclease [Candidatus Acidoferrum sp.]|nr:S1/P1 nuclease [Candidatus Acidoferrum sp.]